MLRTRITALVAGYGLPQTVTGGAVTVAMLTGQSGYLLYAAVAWWLVVGVVFPLVVLLLAVQGFRRYLVPCIHPTLLALVSMAVALAGIHPIVDGMAALFATLCVANNVFGTIATMVQADELIGQLGTLTHD